MRSSPVPQGPPELEKIVRQVFTAVSPHVGELFFQTLVTSLATQLSVSYAAVSEAEDKSGNFLNVLASTQDGALQPRFTYAGEGTPCGKVMEEGFACYPSQLKQAFPDDHFLEEIGAEAYAGIALRLGNEKPMGHLCIMDRGALEHGNTIRALLELIAARVTAELMRLRTERERDEERRRNNTLLSNMPGMAYRCDIDPDRKMLFVSEGCRALTGYSRKALSGKTPFSDLIHKSDRTKVERQIKKALQEKTRFQATYRLKCKDDTVKWVWEQGLGIYDEAGDLIAIEGFITDVSEQVRVKSNLQKHKEKLNDMVRKRTQTLDQRNTELENEVAVRRQAQAKEQISREIATTSLHNVGNVINSVNIASEGMLRTLKSSKLSSLNRVAKMIQENSENPCEYFCEDPKGKLIPEFIIHLTQAVQEEHAELQEEISNMLRQVRLIKEVTAGQQSLARTKQESVSFKLSRLVDSVARIQLAFGWGRSVDVIKDFEVPGYLHAPRTPIVHILINLIKNAKEALLDNAAGDRIMRFRIWKEAESLYLSISENGLGIEPEALKNLFTFGFTTKNDGHGFGLHYCKNIMTNLGGEISVASEGPGKGSTFTLRFPKSLLEPED